MFKVNLTQERKKEEEKKILVRCFIEISVVGWLSFEV